MTGQRYKNTVDRILSQCALEDRDPHSRGMCWSWRGAVSRDGYGRITMRVKGKPWGKWVHKVLYELTVAPLPEHATLDHTCYNKRCCNPRHLEVVTRSENTKRARARFMRETRTSATI